MQDYRGDALEKEEGMSSAKSNDIKSILNEVAKVGLYQMSTASKIKAAKMMIFHHMKMNDAVTLYNKYIGDWGGSATEYKFEAVKDGKVVKEIIKTPTGEVRFEIKADHTNLKTEGDAKIIGPNVISLSGGMGGTYVRTIQKEGKAKLIVKDAYGKTKGEVSFDIEL